MSLLLLEPPQQAEFDCDNSHEQVELEPCGICDGSSEALLMYLGLHDNGTTYWCKECLMDMNVNEHRICELCHWVVDYKTGENIPETDYGHSHPSLPHKWVPLTSELFDEYLSFSDSKDNGGPGSLFVYKFMFCHITIAS